MDEETAEYLNAEVATKITCGAFSSTFSNITINEEIFNQDASIINAAIRILAEDSFKILDGLISVSTFTSYSELNSPSMQRREIDKQLLDPMFLTKIEMIGNNIQEVYMWPKIEVATE